MIARHIPGTLEDFLMDKEALAEHLKCSEASVRRYGKSVGKDELTSRALYNSRQVKEAMAAVEPRPERQGVPTPRRVRSAT